jgi:glycine oxidase
MTGVAKVVVVGGGVIGCACAELLSRERHQVTLLERDQVGAHASGAAAGLLAPYSEFPDTDVGDRSSSLFPELVARIESASGVEVEYRPGESLAVAFEEEERLGGGRWMDAAACRNLEPGLNHDLLGATLFRQAQITPPRFVQALARTASAQGASVRPGTPATGFELSAGEVRGVRAGSELIASDFVVLAAGPWTPEVASRAGIDVGVLPRRGQLVALRPADKVLRRIVTWGHFYLVPKPDGTVVLGSTEEEAGFDARPTAAGISVLLEVAQHLVPALARATVERVWAALRPATEDGLPVVGPSNRHANVILATGHNRNGILLAPHTAVTVAELIRS